MDATRPEIISYWSLDLRVRNPQPGSDIRVDGDNVNDLIRLDMIRWEWRVPQLYELTPGQAAAATVVPVLETGPLTTSLSLTLDGDRDVVVRGDRIVFRNSALTTVVDQGAGNRVLTEPVDGTENVSLRATVCGVGTETYGAALANLSNDTTVLPVAAHQPFEPSRGANRRLRDFQRVQPIFYLEQDEGFVLLAEAFQSAEERRLIYTLQAVSPDDLGGTKGPTRSIPARQVRATTPAFRLADPGALHTIRAHQDGNLSFGGPGKHGGYLEFWVNGLPLGIRRLPDARFRFRGGPATLYIGGWPRPKAEPLFLTGEIVHINFDPINKCTPC